MKVAPQVIRSSILALWAATFAWLWISGEVDRYLGPRTRWVVVVGALGLAFAAIVAALSIGRRSMQHASLRGLGVLIVPLLALIAVPQPDLGALAAARKSAGRGVGAAAGLAPPAVQGDEISFIHIHFASRSADYALNAGIVDGTEVALVGFVTESAEPGAAFDLTRFYISCCAADAVPYAVPVIAEADHPPETWLRVEGELVESEGRWVVSADRVTEVSRPEDPYLY